MKKSLPSYKSQELREFAEVLRGRRTINLYLQTPVPKELIRDAVEAATWAPNHGVTEPWRFYRLGSKSIGRCLDLVRELVTAKKGEKAGAFKAQSWSEKPGWLVVTCKSSDDELLQREDYAACATAVQTFMLYLWKAGVGSKTRRSTGGRSRGNREQAVRLGHECDRQHRRRGRRGRYQHGHRGWGRVDVTRAVCHGQTNSSVRSQC